MSTPSLIRNYEVDARSTDVFGRVLCHARDHHFIVDGPVQNGCPGEELTPPEVFLSGVAACGVELVQVIAREQDKKVGSVHLVVRGIVDRGNQARTDVTVLNALHLDFEFRDTDRATATALVDGFRKR